MSKLLFSVVIGAVATISMADVIPAVICGPDPSYNCPGKKTCCKIPGGYGCCPLPDAVCCSDQIHCCDQGTTCNVRAGTCDKPDGKLAMSKKMEYLIFNKKARKPIV